MKGKLPPNKKKRRTGVMLSWNDIKGLATEEELRGVRSKKTVQNWKSGDHDEKKIPASALASLLAQWWLDERREREGYAERRVAETRTQYEAKLRTIRNAAG